VKYRRVDTASPVDQIATWATRKSIVPRQTEQNMRCSGWYVQELELWITVYRVDVKGIVVAKTRFPLLPMVV
jgi:hypothetical protein